MSTPEWGAYLVSAVGVRLTATEASDGVIAGMAERYEEGPPLLPGAVETVRAVASRFPVAIASSSPPVLIRSFLHSTGLDSVIEVAVSSEEVGRGKPAPDVYLKAAASLGVPAAACYAVEDSTNGLRAALAAGMTVFAVPNEHFPPDPSTLSKVSVLGSIVDLPGALA